ncbi:MAG: hypothetical protein KKC79_20550 [Gammaproteobacteria bacterium]|nr:hypothetical protein [Gammaproteobacteria bacterium]MBU1440028.1 hypothetical protein [Gammaproteobacteria bacterium]MBU2411027.1 hypothetical protein [Gammaproteobacteria bacterium]
MKWLVFLPLAWLVAGCGTPANEVIPLGDGVLRAPTYARAAAYCDSKDLTARWLGKAQAEAGVKFQCR